MDELTVGRITFGPVARPEAPVGLVRDAAVFAAPRPVKRTVVDRVADMIAALGEAAGNVNSFLADLAADNLERAEEAEAARDFWHRSASAWRSWATFYQREKDAAAASRDEWKDSALEKINRLVITDRRLTWEREGRISAERAAKTARTALEFAVRDLATATGRRHDPHDARRLVTNYLADAAQAIAGNFETDGGYGIGDPGDEAARRDDRKTADKRAHLLEQHRLNSES